MGYGLACVVEAQRRVSMPLHVRVQVSSSSPGSLIIGEGLAF